MILSLMVKLSSAIFTNQNPPFNVQQVAYKDHLLFHTHTHTHHTHTHTHMHTHTHAHTHAHTHMHTHMHIHTHTHTHTRTRSTVWDCWKTQQLGGWRTLITVSRPGSAETLRNQKHLQMAVLFVSMIDYFFYHW